VTANVFDASAYGLSYLPYIDVFSGEKPGLGLRNDHWYRYAYAYAGGKPTVLTNAPNEYIASINDDMRDGKPDGYLLQVLDAYAQGVCMAVGYGGWLGHLRKDAVWMPKPLADRLGRWLKDNEALFPATPVADTALLFDHDAGLEEELFGGLSSGVLRSPGAHPARQVFTKMGALLCRHHRLYRVEIAGASAPLTPERLAAYKNVILPDCYRLPETDRVVVQAWIDAGGRALIVGEGPQGVTRAAAVASSDDPAALAWTIAAPQRVMVTEPDTVALALHETADGYALHLVNYSMNAETKGVERVAEMTVTLDVDARLAADSILPRRWRGGDAGRAHALPEEYRAVHHPPVDVRLSATDRTWGDVYTADNCLDNKTIMRSNEAPMNETFDHTWRSLRTHVTPQWFRDAKFGIYTHWGVYSVPACGTNGSWYPYNMYRPDTARDRAQYEYHVKTYGPPSEFGYKDLIPLFTGEKFDPDEWAALFKQAGAQFAGPVGEHHDGFAMWDSQLTEWNAVRMGPKRDVVGELARAIRQQGMRYMVALHHAENWWFFPHWHPDFDTADPRYVGLYGPLHNMDGDVGPGPVRPQPGASGHTWPFEEQDKPSKEFLDLWKAKTLEVIDLYRPDLLWFDFALERIQEQYKREFLAHYYKAREWGKEVVVTYKYHHVVPGAAVVDLELGRFKDLTYHDWVTDSSVDDQGAWSYVQDAGFKPVSVLVHNLVDNVSKNGYLLLNVGPQANGAIPEPAKECLRGMGQWLAVNGEAMYGTTPWMTYGEGPTQMQTEGAFSEEQEVAYTAQDIRFTVKDDTLYATCLGWPGEQVTIKSAAPLLYESEIQSVTMLGREEPLDWRLTPEELIIHRPVEKPCEHAYVFKIARCHPF